MDLWVIAAAAGAGCIAKNLQNFSPADKKESPRGPSLKYSNNFQTESRNFLQQLRDKTCPLRRLAQKSAQDHDAFLDSESRDRNDGVYSDTTAVLEDYSLCQQYVDGENMNLSKISGGKFSRNRRCGVHPIRPLSSLESCVDNMEHSSCLYPSMSQSRPVLLTDATWGESSSSTQPDDCLKETKEGTKTPPPSFKQLESLEELKNLKKGSNILHSSHSQGAEAMLLFVTGMTIGILSANISGKDEVDKLNMQLKQMQGLVQDLHDELDLKETVMVRELDSEVNLPSGGGDTIKEPISSPSAVKANEKKAENLELLNRIEAELQAELEMLEQNMKVHVSDQDRISSFVELDPDFEPEIVQGELKPSMVEAATDSGSKTADTTTTETADCSKPVNYAIPPWELSLKLHELIESRLQMRVKELETELLHSQTRVAMQHSIVCGRRYSSSETESSSTQHHSPTCCICDEEHRKRDDEHSDDGESGSNGAGRRLLYGIQSGVMSVDNEDSMSEDESEMLLIKQIIERRKSGSGFNFKID